MQWNDVSWVATSRLNSLAPTILYLKNVRAKSVRRCFVTDFLASRHLLEMSNWQVSVCMSNHRNLPSRLFRACLPLLMSLPGSAQNTPTTPIKHLVVIFQENVSFDHYFATYPEAANPGADPVLLARLNTPSANAPSCPSRTTHPNSLH